MKFLYVEEGLLKNPHTRLLEERLKAKVIPIKHYGEIFNRHGSHFSLQKHRRALILAQKRGRLVYKIPYKFGFGTPHNYYFSHLLNCPFDCRYCYLQGMYRSAHYVLFLNFADFEKAILEKIGKDSTAFFAGYHSDSLALEGYTNFLDYFLPLFEKHPTAVLELRTKSVNIHKLLQLRPIQNCIIAFSLNPEKIASVYEPHAPSLTQRLQAMGRLQEEGWNIGLRFDPIIYTRDYKDLYRPFFRRVLSLIKDPHSITLGTFRLSPPLLKEMRRVNPQEQLLTLCQGREGLLPPLKEREMLSFCLSLLPKDKVFVCQ